MAESRRELDDGQRRKGYERRMTEFALSLGVLAAFSLAGGGIWLIAKRRDRKRGVLMLLAALVLLGNVWILTAPIT